MVEARGNLGLRLDGGASATMDLARVWREPSYKVRSETMRRDCELKDSEAH